jgi:hypothetical protein
LTALTLPACGGGGGSSSPSRAPVVNQSVGGIWTTQYTVTSGANTGDVIDAQGLISENGQFFGYSKNTTNGCASLGFGQLSVNGTSITGNEDWVLVQYATLPGVQTNCVESDGSKSGTGTITGTVSQRASLTFTAAETTSFGTVSLPSTTTWTFSNLYLNASSLGTIAGNYSDGGPTLNISSNGVIFEQDANGCVLSGQVSIVNPSYNTYAIEFAFSNCTGSAAAINGVAVSGLATLDTNTSPTTLVGGVTGNVGGRPFAEGFVLPLI